MPNSDARNSRIVRLPIYKKEKSGRFFCIHRAPGLAMIHLSQDLSSVTAVQSRRFIKRNDSFDTGAVLECEVFKRSVGQGFELSVLYLRVLTSKDMDLILWSGDVPLSALPVLVHPHVTREEMHWAGYRPAEIGTGIALLLVAMASFALTRVLPPSSFNGVLLILALVCVVFSLKAKWKLRKKADPAKLAELSEYKIALKASDEKRRAGIKTEFQSKLKLFKSWQNLEPYVFEQAIRFYKRIYKGCEEVRSGARHRSPQHQGRDYPMKRKALDREFERYRLTP
ncbi:MAG: hypothetical protein ING19_07380 [Azospirillum sp.]|nr:hypothetical protein [Azospirillum sp.]